MLCDLILRTRNYLGGKTRNPFLNGILATTFESAGFIFSISDMSSFAWSRWWVIGKVLLKSIIFIKLFMVSFSSFHLSIMLIRCNTSNSIKIFQNSSDSNTSTSCTIFQAKGKGLIAKNIFKLTCEFEKEPIKKQSINLITYLRGTITFISDSDGEIIWKGSIRVGAGRITRVAWIVRLSRTSAMDIIHLIKCCHTHSIFLPREFFW